MVIDKIRIPIELWQFEEVLEKRIGEGIHLENLFIVGASEAAVPNPGFYDTFIETKFGKIRFFFSLYCQKEKFYVLHKAKFDYPRPRNQTDHFDRNGDLVK